MGSSKSHIEVPEETVRDQVARIIQSPRFNASEKQKRFLQFIVDEAFEGRAAQLKAYTVAIAVYDRPSTFDPQSDPIVRVEAGRLRRALKNYYLSSDEEDLVSITIPKGGYIPLFKDISISFKDDMQTQPASSHQNPFAGPSIVLAPLVNLSGEKNQDYFVDGLTEELTSELARFQDISVIASQSAMRLKDQKLEPKEVGQDLGVRFLLTGSVRKGTADIKVTIQLYDTATAEQMWGMSFKENLVASDLIIMQETISQHVVGRLADHYGLINRRLSKESRKKCPSTLKSYDAVLKF